MGEFESFRMKNCKLHELESDGTVTISEVTYDVEEDKKNYVSSHDQEPIAKNPISTGNPLTKLEEQEKQTDGESEYLLSWKVANEESKQLLIKKLKQRIEALEEQEQSYPIEGDVDGSLEESVEEAD
jgi:hypothetical protein